MSCPEPFRGRAVTYGAPARVHRNLNRRDGVWWSVVQNGLVVAYARRVALRGAVAHTNETAQRRIAAGAARSVHAWVAGTLVADELPDGEPVHYRPHVSPHFHDESGAVYLGSETATFTGDGMFATGLIHSHERERP